MGMDITFVLEHFSILIFCLLICAALIMHIKWLIKELIKSWQQLLYSRNI